MFDVPNDTEEVENDGPVEIDDWMLQIDNEAQSMLQPEEEDNDEIEETESSEEEVEEPQDDYSADEIVKRGDGKYQYGKLVADTVEELVIKADKSRWHAEKKMGQTLAEAKAAMEAGGDEDFDDDDYGVDLSTEIAQGIASAFQTGGFGGQQQPDNHAAAMQAITVARGALSDPDVTPQDYSAVADMLIQFAPDSAELNQVFAKWGEVDPYNALSKRQDLMMFAQQLHVQQQEQQAQQYAQQEWEETHERQTALESARTGFAQEHPDWAHYGAGINEFLLQNPVLMETVAGNEQGIKSVLTAALAHAKMVGGAGVGLPAAESGGSMIGDMTQPTQQSLAAQQATREEARTMAGLETGSGEDVHVVVNSGNKNSEQPASLSDLIGMEIVG